MTDAVAVDRHLTARLPLSSTLVCAILLLAQAPLLAQDAEPDSFVQETFGKKIDLVWEGGSVGGLFEKLSAQLEGNVNFVVTPGAKDVQVPAFLLRNTAVPTICALLASVVSDLDLSIAVGGLHEPAQNIREFDDDYLEEMVRAFGAPVLIVKLATRNAEDEPINRSLRLFRLSVVLEHFKLEELATAIETAWAFLPGSSAGTLKFHPETKLLICSGTPFQVEIAEQVIDDLLEQIHEDTSHQRDRDLGIAAHEKAELRNQITELRQECDRLRLLLAESQKKRQEPK